MDSSLLQLSEFSSALTEVLTNLDKKVKKLDSGGTRVLSLAEQVDEHDEIIKSIESNINEQKEAFQEAINAHATMGKAVMEATTTQCGDLQQELVELRTTTKKELSSLQGVLEVSLRDSIMHLTEYMQPAAPTEIPVVTSDTSSQELMNIMMSRIDRLEKKVQSQELANQMLKDSIQSNANAQDLFDELTSRVVQSERKSEKQERKVHAYEKRLAALATCQSKTLKLINVISQKVNVLATISWEKTSSLDVTDVKAVSLNAIIEKEVPPEYIPEHTQVAVEVFQEALMESEKESSPEEGLAKLMRGTKPDGPLVAKRKSTLRGHAMAKANSFAQRTEQMKEQMKEEAKEEVKEEIKEEVKVQPVSSVKREVPVKTSSSVSSMKTKKVASQPPPAKSAVQAKTAQMYPTLLDDTNRSMTNGVQEEGFHEPDHFDDYSQMSMDSSVLVEEYVMEKLEYLEEKVNELMAARMSNTNGGEHLTHLATRQEDAEYPQEVGFSMVPVPSNGVPTDMAGRAFVATSNPTVMKENAFRFMIRDMKDAWDLAFAELDKKVQKMNQVIEQMGTQPDDLHRRLSAFKAKVTNALEVISVALPESRSEIITSIYDVMEDVRQDAQQVVVFEEEIRNIIEKKDPGTALTVSQIPTHLPELLQEACHKTTEVLGEKIEKYDLSVRIDELATLLKSKVDLPNFISLEEEIRIALTLKADQKQMEEAIDKKSSIVDAEKYREYVTDEIDAMRAILATSAQRTQNFQSASANAAEFESMTAAMTQRMDKLFKNLQETTSRVNGFVPRQEIETALQALLNEVKNVRASCIDKKGLEERLQHKADHDEVEKLLSILQGTVGDPLSTQQAAIQKCLVCDKPVNPFQQSTNRPNSPTTYFDKASAPGGSGSPSNMKRPQTTTGLPRTQTYPEKVRQTAEMNILRNSMESLPALDDSRIGVNNGGGSTLSRQGSRSNNLSAHSRRIRSAAGGGLGPSYQQDSR